MIVTIATQYATKNLSSFLTEKNIKDAKNKNNKVSKIIQQFKERNKQKKKKNKKNKGMSKICIIHDPEILGHVHYLNPQMLSLFMNSKGLIHKGRFNSICCKHQRHLRRHIIISRHLHLLPYVIY